MEQLINALLLLLTFLVTGKLLFSNAHFFTYVPWYLWAIGYSLEVVIADYTLLSSLFYVMAIAHAAVQGVSFVFPLASLLVFIALLKFHRSLPLKVIFLALSPTAISWVLHLSQGIFLKLPSVTYLLGAALVLSVIGYLVSEDDNEIPRTPL